MGTDPATDDPLISTLYQLADVDLAEVDFAGGHGFTGLQYGYHDGAMLQCWCDADG